MYRGFEASEPTADDLKALAQSRRNTAADVIRLTTLAGSGHPGGSLSTLDALLVLYRFGHLRGDAPHAADRDRVVISHGHISPGVYATLAHHGFFDIREAYAGFRRAGSVFGGHIESVVPGVEWNTGNLGQGLSAGCGYALAARIHGRDHRVFVGMGDGEQQKGQIAEARRFAHKYKLDNLVAFVDVNGLQIGGDTAEIMPTDLDAEWSAAGWRVLHVDGHDHTALYRAFREATRGETGGRPTVLLLETVMGKGIPFIEHQAKYHGSTLSDEQAAEAFRILEVENDLDVLRALRAERSATLPHTVVVDREIHLDTGAAAERSADVHTDCRSAYGEALEDLAARNAGDEAAWPVVGLSCDLEGSVKMNAFHARTPDRFFEVGIQEHNAAVIAGTLSKEGIVPFFSTFGMFGVVETYNQQRLNDQNHAAPKTVVTHCGLDVGEDGPTHQCIDYVALGRNLFGMEVYAPADPNETDHVIRAVATRYAPTIVAMGRSKMPTVTLGDGRPAFGRDYAFTPGQWPTVREGTDAVVFAFGTMVGRAVKASELLAPEGIALRVVNASSLQPFDRECILACARDVGVLLTYEDHNVHTGLGAMVAGVLGDEGVAARLQRLGVSRYGTSGKPDDLFAEQGLAPEHLAEAVRAMVRG